MMSNQLPRGLLKRGEIRRLEVKPSGAEPGHVVFNGRSNMSNKSLKQTGNIQGRKAGGTYARCQRSARSFAASARRTFLKRDAAAEVREETVTLNMFGEPGTGTWSVGSIQWPAESVVIDPTTIIS